MVRPLGCTLAALPILPAVYVAYDLENKGILQQLAGSVALALLGFWATRLLIPNFTPFLVKRGLTGKDLCKVGTAMADKPIPEATGVLPGTIFLIGIICLQLFSGNTRDKLTDYHSALLSVCFMLLLGFADDVLDLPWRYKLVLPTIASLPVLCAYTGSTQVMIPKPLNHLLVAEDVHTHSTLGALLNNLVAVIPPIDHGAVLVDLGPIYMVYMALLAVFCSNAVNIYAGINGLEAGQSFIIGCAILTHNMIELASGRFIDNHIFSAILILPFLGTTLGLLSYNWYPARVFVGDTYCYFAGMTFAVVGILGHFSKTLVLMFIPQVVNFLLSVPQLIKIVPCPRHRLPRYNVKTGLMEPSTVKSPNGGIKFLDARGEPGSIINLTLINVMLQICGPMREQNLTILLLALQAGWCAVGFWIRYHFANMIYGT